MPQSLCCTSRLQQQCASYCSGIDCADGTFIKKVLQERLSQMKPAGQRTTIAVPTEPESSFPSFISQGAGFEFSIDQRGIDSLNSNQRPIITYRNGKNDGETYHKETSGGGSSSSGIIAKSKGLPPSAEKIFPESMEVMGGSDSSENARPIALLPPSSQQNSFLTTSPHTEHSNAHHTSVAHLSQIWSIQVKPHNELRSHFNTIDSKWLNIDSLKLTPNMRTSNANLNKSSSHHKVPRPEVPPRILPVLPQIFTHPPIATTAASVIQRLITPEIDTATPRPAQCGTAPDFIPCVSTPEANARMLQCCQAKLLPIGCQNLCKYDVTQAEIKQALDQAQCSILHVAPIVECASGGQDNIDCCRYKQVAIKR
ncbi:unnamed protein product [Anisakis simplex]|uniref:DB domain-containing protein n=1 Tax=Anisakis simplex TaxID=6269 RepID=A0A0M3K422_ANISI|nr:unnamed protein product [Anisakis simplex]